MANTEACHVLWGLCLSTKIDVGLFVTVILFVCGIMFNSYIDRRKKKDARRSYIKALSEEIKLNLKNLEKTERSFPSLHEINEFMAKNSKNRPFLTFNYFSSIYKSRTEIIQDLPEVLIRGIVEFYGKLEDISIDSAAIEKHAFARISRSGREGIIVDLFANLRVALQLGLAVSDSIELLLSREPQF